MRQASFQFNGPSLKPTEKILVNVTDNWLDMVTWALPTRLMRAADAQGNQSKHFPIEYVASAQCNVNYLSYS